MQTAGAVIIGDEILSGKVRDRNSPLLIDMLRSVGVDLRQLMVIGDEPTEIVPAVQQFAGRYDHVFTSGGLGPTHDDRTIEAIALAFDRPVVKHPDLVRLIEEHVGDRVNDDVLRMANCPQGAELIGGGPFPLMRYENIFILPGVPKIFAAKLETIRSLIGGGKPPTVGYIYLKANESDFASLLRQADLDFPAVRFGSYPRLDEKDYRVLITVECNNYSDVELAVQHLLGVLSDEMVARWELDARAPQVAPLP